VLRLELGEILESSLAQFADLIRSHRPEIKSPTLRGLFAHRNVCSFGPKCRSLAIASGAIASEGHASHPPGAKIASLACGRAPAQILWNDQ
jgi:hypothetical protein